MKNIKLSLKFFIVTLLFITHFSSASAQYQHTAELQKATIENFDIRIRNNYSELETILLFSACYGFVFDQVPEQISVSKDKPDDDEILSSRNVYPPEAVNALNEFMNDTPFSPQEFYDCAKKNKDDNANDVYETILFHD